jgi:hypothetical protein
MELWRLKKRYRALAVRLRRAKSRSLAVLKAEELVLVALWLGDRVETELAVVRCAKRAARGRLRRLRVWLDNAGLLADAPLHLVRPDDLAALEHFDEHLTLLGATEATGALQQLRGELRHLEGRITDVGVRLERVAELVAQHLEHLEACVRAGVERLPPSSQRSA